MPFGPILLVARSSNSYIALASIVLFVHALFIIWVALGAIVARNRPVLRWLHIASLCWGILAEVLPFTCPLTYLENWFESRAGIQPYEGGFLLHYLDRLVYPGISASILTTVAVIVCSVNLLFYLRQLQR